MIYLNKEEETENIEEQQELISMRDINESLDKISPRKCEPQK